MASNDLGDWYRSIPQISRYWFTGAVALPLAGKLGLFNPMTMILHYEMVVHHFQVRGHNVDISVLTTYTWIRSLVVVKPRLSLPGQVGNGLICKK